MLALVNETNNTHYSECTDTGSSSSNIDSTSNESEEYAHISADHYNEIEDIPLRGEISFTECYELENELDIEKSRKEVVDNFKHKEEGSVNSVMNKSHDDGVQNNARYNDALKQLRHDYSVGMFATLVLRLHD